MTKPPGLERHFKRLRKHSNLPCQMEVDRISNLPGNIVDKILCCLKLKDAVRTSILSRKWRYKWVNLTSLVFDDQLVHVSSKYPPVLRDQMVKIVDRVLLLHNGLIHKFRLSFHGFRDIDRWILFLSRGSVKEIVLEILEICPSDPYFKLGSSLYSCDKPYYKLPSSLYLCDKLSHLQLSNCLLKPPSTFNGFKMLTNLDLSKISMEQDRLENLIFKCPLLERLTLMDIYGLGHLKIHAPKLTFFDFGGVFEDVTFENTVHLSTVSICFYLKIGNDNESSLGTTSKLIKFFGSLPSIQRLEVESSVLKFLAGDDMVPRTLPTPCIELNYLSLGINFSDMEQCLAALCILRNSPNLMELEMLSQSYKRPASSRAVTKKLMEEDYQNCSFNQLRCVKLAGSFGFRRALKFINFLLANSPMLERMTVNPHSEDSAVELLKELVQSRREFIIHSIIKEWNVELQERTGKFRKQANAIAEWDKRSIFLQNQDVLLKLKAEVAMVVETQSNLERQDLLKNGFLFEEARLCGKLRLAGRS